MRAIHAGVGIVLFHLALGTGCGGSGEELAASRDGGGEGGGPGSGGSSTAGRAGTAGNGTSSGGDGGRAGGAGGSGASGSNGSSGAGGSSADGCPAPVPTGTCNQEGLRCESAGSPCATVTTCTAGSWRSTTLCPPANDCPESLPADGAQCSLASPVSGPLTCDFDECPEGTLHGPRFEATCSDSAWSVRELECRPAIECGECPPGVCCDGDCSAGQALGRNQCAVGEVCLRTLYAGGNWTWDCAPDHCAPDPIDCACVGEVCGQRGFPGDWQCTAASAPEITCECTDGC